MARKFGKKNKVSLNPLDANLCLLGLPKIGKTTICKEMAEKLVGEDGYLFLEMYRENGAKYIEDIVYEDVPDWGSFCDIIDDIIDNRTTDYKDFIYVSKSLEEPFSLNIFLYIAARFCVTAPGVLHTSVAISIFNKSNLTRTLILNSSLSKPYAPISFTLKPGYTLSIINRMSSHILSVSFWFVRILLRNIS